MERRSSSTASRVSLCRHVFREVSQKRVMLNPFVNKFDCCGLDLQMKSEDMYVRFRMCDGKRHCHHRYLSASFYLNQRVPVDAQEVAPESLKRLDSFRSAYAGMHDNDNTYNDVHMSDVQAAPEKVTVSFGSSLHGRNSMWSFATIYASKMCGVTTTSLSRRKPRRTSSSQRTNKPLQRVFCQVIMGKISQLMRVIINGDKEKYTERMGSLNIVPSDETQWTGKMLIK